MCSEISAVGGLPSGQPYNLLPLHSALGLFSSWKACQSFLVPILLGGLEFWALRSRLGLEQAALVANVLGLQLDFGVPRYCAYLFNLIGN